MLYLSATLQKMAFSHPDWLLMTQNWMFPQHFAPICPCNSWSYDHLNVRQVILSDEAFCSRRICNVLVQRCSFGLVSLSELPGASLHRECFEIRFFWWRFLLLTKTTGGASEQTWSVCVEMCACQTGIKSDSKVCLNEGSKGSVR